MGACMFYLFSRRFDEDNPICTVLYLVWRFYGYLACGMVVGVPDHILSPDAWAIYWCACLSLILFGYGYSYTDGKNVIHPFLKTLNLQLNFGKNLHMNAVISKGHF